MQKLGLVLPLKEIYVFFASLLDISVTIRSTLGKSNFLKLLLFYWVLVSMLLSNLYRGIVVENIVAPTNFLYPVNFDDLKVHSFQIFAIESFDKSDLSLYKSAFFHHLITCAGNELCDYRMICPLRCLKRNFSMFTKRC